MINRLSKLEIQGRYLIMTTMVKKEYDCVKSVRKEREKISMETEGLTPSEILEYFRMKRKRQASMKAQNEEDAS